MKDVPSKRECGFVELDGAPDIVIEVVSNSSVKKDRRQLKQANWEAGMPVYWIIDARNEPMEFVIYRSTATKYVAVRNADGWIKSPVFGSEFRLIRINDEVDRPDVRLEVR